MINKEVEIVNETGLHTRPGNQFVKLAKQFDCAVNIRKGEGIRRAGRSKRRGVG